MRTAAVVALGLLSCSACGKDDTTQIPVTLEPLTVGKAAIAGNMLTRLVTADFTIGDGAVGDNARGDVRVEFFANGGKLNDAVGQDGVVVKARIVNPSSRGRRQAAATLTTDFGVATEVFARIGADYEQVTAPSVERFSPVVSVVKTATAGAEASEAELRVSTDRGELKGEVAAEIELTRGSFVSLEQPRQRSTVVRLVRVDPSPAETDEGFVRVFLPDKGDTRFVVSLAGSDTVCQLEWNTTTNTWTVACGG